MRRFLVALMIILVTGFVFSGCDAYRMNTNSLMSGVLGIDTAKDEFNEMRSLYVYCKYVDGKAYDIYNYTLGETYAKEAQKAYAKGKGPNFERARIFSLMAIPHLKIVQKKYLESEG